MDSTQPHLVESAALPYLLWVPEPRAAAPTLPVLCFLHGYDEGAPLPIQEALTRHGPLRPGNSARALREFVIIAPQLPIRGDLWHRHADDVLEIVRQVQALHRGDPQRSYLTGFSFGGNGVFDLGLRQGQVWAALWAVDPTRVPQQSLNLPVWLSSGELSRRHRRQFVERLALQPLAGGGATERIYLDQQQGHVATATLAYADERIYSWLLARQR